MRFTSAIAALGISASLVLPIHSALRAQEGIEEDLRVLTSENAARYIEPLTRGTAMAMGGGVVDGAVALPRFGFDIGVRMVGAIPVQSAQSFAVALPDEISWGGENFQAPYRLANQDGLSPTAVGEGAGSSIEPNGDFRSALQNAGEDPADYELSLPSGHDAPVVPHPTVFATLGLGWGTDIGLHVVPGVRVDEEIGTFRGIGFAARHTITHWTDSRLDFTVVAAWQRLEVGSYAEASSTQLGIVAGRSLGPLSLFATGLVREGTAEVRYEVGNSGDMNPLLPPDGTAIEIDEALEPDAVFGVGARLQFLILNLAAQISFDEYPVVTLKAGLGSR